MKDRLFSFLHFSSFCFLISCCTAVYAQRDTLHIYYKGLQTEVVDSNYAKISKWAETLKGKHYVVEILAYYDMSDFKKGMTERAENIQTVVIRKARDYTNITFSGPMKGKKSQRMVADIVYSQEGSAAPLVNTKTENKKAAGKPADTPKHETKKKEKTVEAKKEEKEVEEEKPVETAAKSPEPQNAPVVPARKTRLVLTDDKYNYYEDSTYKNGVLKLVKRKEKRK